LANGCATQAEPTIIVVLGAWSCGSTAVAGYLERAGAYSPRPHQTTNDPKTPDSHEPKALRDALVERIDERTLQHRSHEGPVFRDWLAEWIGQQRALAGAAGHSHVVIKHPLLALSVADVAAVCQPRFVAVTRELVHIEATRRRRRWLPVYGRQGARALYNAIFGVCLEHTVSAMVCHYAQFRRDADLRHRLCHWTGLSAEADGRAEAEGWLR